MPEKNTIIIGHKNPDTDSICSALGYAAFKKAMGTRDVIAARAGNINPQTEFVLRYFGKEQPVYLSDVYPKIRDVMTTDFASVPQKASLCSVINAMGNKNVRFMPVTENGRPVGLLSMSALAEQLIIGNPASARKVYTSVSNVIEGLQARPVYVVSAEEEFTASVFVGAMAEGTFRDVIRKDNPNNCIVIVGDREEIHHAAIDQGVRLLIVTGGLGTRPEIERLARENRVSLIVSPFDSATTAWFTLLSSPVGHFCTKDFLVVSEAETVREFKARIKNGVAVVTNASGLLTGVIAPSDFLRSSGIRLILVDHNEFSQAVDGATEVEVEEVIDHHRLGNFHTSTPIRFINEPVGSTSTLIAERFFREGLEPERGIAGLLLSGIISDTLMLKSPTATERDRVMIERLSKVAGVDPVPFSGELFKASSGFMGRMPSEIISSDFKSYEEKGKRFGIAQVEVVGFADFYDVRDAMEEELIRTKEAKGYSLIGLLVTDISYGNSLLLAISDPEVASSLGYPMIGRNLYELKGVLSRKKQVVPHILNLFSKLYER